MPAASTGAADLSQCVHATATWVVLTCHPAAAAPRHPPGRCTAAPSPQAHPCTPAGTRLCPATETHDEQHSGLLVCGSQPVALSNEVTLQMAVWNHERCASRACLEDDRQAAAHKVKGQLINFFKAGCLPLQPLLSPCSIRAVWKVQRTLIPAKQSASACFSCHAPKCSPQVGLSRMPAGRLT